MTVYTGSCGSNATWAYDDESKVLTISGTGAMTDYTGTTLPPWYSYLITQVTQIIIEYGITRIGTNAFKTTVDTLCTSVSIPSSVTSIGDNAFAFQSKLTTPIDLPRVQTIGEYAFIGCSKIPSLVFGAKLQSIGKYAFNDCYAITEVTFRGTQPSLGQESFTFGNSSHRVTATMYSRGWASDSVFTSGNNGIKGSYTTFTYVVKVPATANVNVNGTPRTYRICVNVGGTWHTVATAYGKLNGTWMDVGQ